MPPFNPERLAAEWLSLNERCGQDTRNFVQQFFTQHAAGLADFFYQTMMADSAAAAFLSNDDVHNRLQFSMQRWLSGLFSAVDEETANRLIAEQRKVGEIHARINIPVHLVLRGARHIKDHFIYLLSQGSDLPQQQAVAAVRLMSDTIDLAMEVMGHAYSVSHDRNSRAEEAYRLFAITQNITNEKDQQKAALLDWENQLMFEQAVGHSAAHLPRICRSEFGLWLRHKAVHAFEGSAEIERVLDTMEQIDEVILPLFSAPSPDQNSELSRIQLLRDLREKVKSIRFHMDNLFDQNNELEAGRDVLTRLLNRKFLPVVLTKQIANAKARHSSFTVLMVDIDHFKQVNDTYGHQAGDSVLQQLALILVNNSRSGDYLFRLGGEEFMLVLVDTDVTGARPMAEKLRKSVEQEAFLLPQEQKIHLTVSIGAACFDGHPDYMHLLQKADEALYQVKNNGRNQVIFAG